MTPQTLERTIARGLGWIAVASAVVAVCDLVSLALILRYWVDPAQFGLVSVVVTVFGALHLVVEAGLPSAIVRSDDADPRRLSSALWVSVGLGAAMWAALWVAAPALARAHGDPLIGDLFRVAGAMLVLRPLHTTHEALLRRALRFDRLSQVRVAANVVELAVKVGTAAGGAGPWCFVFGPIARELTYAIGVPAISPWRPRVVFQLRSLRGDFRFGLRATGGQLLYQLYSNLDYQVVGYVFGAAALGRYRAAYELVLEPVRFLSGIVTTIAYPTFARLRADRDALVDQLLAFTRRNLAVVLICVAAIVASADDLLGSVYGDAYRSAAGMSRVLAIVGALRAMSHLGPPLLDGLGRPDLSLRYQATAAGVLGLAFVVAAHVGDTPLAVAAAWAIGYPLAFLVLAHLVLVQLDLRARHFVRVTGRVFAVAIAATLAGILVRGALACQAPSVRLGVVLATVLAIGVGGLLWEGFTPRAVAAGVPPSSHRG